MPRESREFKYDVLELIRCVRERPCLWDRTLESYKDRLERRTSWEEVFNELDERYDEMTPAEKKLTGEIVLSKWTNIRDAFVKTLKNKYGKPKRRYILHNELEFLVKFIPDNPEDADYSSESTDAPVANLKFEKDADKDSSTSDTYSTRKRPKKRKSVDHYKEVAATRVPIEYEKSNDLDFVAVEEGAETRVMNEDEAFFASLLPSVVKYTEDERLEFRIEVLALMRKIKDNRKWDHT